MTGRIILASASPRRKALLEQVGIEFDVITSEVEEDVREGEPEDVVKDLAYKKADVIANRLLERGEDDFAVIGADTIVSKNGEKLGKPKSRRDAVRMITWLQGGVHEVYTGVSVIAVQGGSRKESTFSECTSVKVQPMQEEAIEEYVETGEPMDKAGGYAIQGKFSAYIQGIEGDYNNVVGLPLNRLLEVLKEM